MKQETNNEMDLLLRRLGRRDDAVVSGGADDHLDADELSAYAENALPAAARTRYTIHLAECSACRSLVVQLSSSAGVIAARESAAVAAPWGLKEFLAGLFTPMVLRYAVPALGLIIVAAIGFVVLRREGASEYVVQDQGAGANAVASPTAQPLKDFNDSTGKNTPSQEGRVENQAKQQTAQPAPPPNMGPVVSSVEADVSKDKAPQSKPDEQAAATANEPAAPKPEPTATPQTRVETEESKKEVLPFSSPQGEKTLRGAQREDRTGTGGVARARKPADAVSVTAGAGAATGSVENVQRDGDSSADTRTVAGRRFRKQGGVWIDTAYDSSKDAVTLTRGSESYRALVADEPAIRTIAETLDGDILVVWKGRTYRIR